MTHVLAIDAGTTGVTVLLVGDDARVHASGYREFPQYFPHPGWVSHDADEIWSATLTATEECLHTGRARLSDVAAIGITNQRETTVVWDRSTGKPIDKAIVWQCRRTAERCELLRVPKSVLPEVRPSSGRFGTTDPDAFLGSRLPISGVAGDQQSALFGQGCFEAGRSKNTYGTGSFLLLNAGTQRPALSE